MLMVLPHLNRLLPIRGGPTVMEEENGLGLKTKIEKRGGIMTAPRGLLVTP